MSGRRVLFWAPTLAPRPSGIRTRLEGLLPHLLADGRHEIALVHGPGVDPADFGPPDRLRSFEADPALARPWRRMLGQQAALETVRDAFPARWVVAETLPLPRCRGLITTVHDLRQQAGSRWVRRLHAHWLRGGLERAEQVHVPSQAIAAEVEALCPGVHPRVVPNGVDLALFHPGPVEGDRALLRARGVHPPYILCVGHFEARKDWRMAVEVAVELARRETPISLVLVGQGEDLPEEELACARATCGRRVGVVLRDVGDEELTVLMRGALALLAPARLEGFGIVPLEALACGTPVIASSIPAHREVLGGYGRLVPPGDVEGVFHAVMDLWADPHAARQQALLGRDRARSFGWATAALHFERALDALETPAADRPAHRARGRFPDARAPGEEPGGGRGPQARP